MVLPQYNGNPCRDGSNTASFQTSVSSYPTNSQYGTPTGVLSIFPPHNATATTIPCSPSRNLSLEETTGGFVPAIPSSSITTPATTTATMATGNSTSSGGGAGIMMVGPRSSWEKSEENANPQESLPFSSPLVSATGVEGSHLSSNISGIDAHLSSFPTRLTPSISLDFLSANGPIPSPHGTQWGKRHSGTAMMGTISSMNIPSGMWNNANDGTGASSMNYTSTLLQGTCRSLCFTGPQFSPVDPFVRSLGLSSSYHPHRRRTSFVTAALRPSTANNILLEVLDTQRQLTRKYYEVNLEAATTSWRSHIQRLHSLRLQQQRRAVLNAQDSEGAQATAEMMEDIVAAVRDRQTDLTPHGNRAFIFPNQDVYEGTWKNARMHGKGLLRRKALKDLYEGQWFLGQRSGKGMYHSTSYQVFYAGSWIDNKRHGNGQLLEPEGLYTGDFHDNNIHGYGEYVYRDGYTYKGEWINGLYDGPGILVHANGTKYEGNWQKGYEHGKGTCNYAIAGEVYEGEWRYGLRHGRGTYIAAAFQYEGEWRYGTVNGKGVCQFTDGSVYEGEWRNGKFHGFGSFTSPHGWVSYTGEFKEGKRNGRGEYKSPMICYKGGWKEDKKEGVGIAVVNGCGEFHGMWKGDQPDGACAYYFWSEGVVWFKDGVCTQKKEVLRFRSINCSVSNGCKERNIRSASTKGNNNNNNNNSRSSSPMSGGNRSVENPKDRRKSGSIKNPEGKQAVSKLLSRLFGTSTHTQPGTTNPFWEENEEDGKEDEENGGENEGGEEGVLMVGGAMNGNASFAHRRGSASSSYSNIHLRRRSHHLTTTSQLHTARDTKKRSTTTHFPSILEANHRSNNSRNGSFLSGSLIVQRHGSTVSANYNNSAASTTSSIRGAVYHNGKNGGGGGGETLSRNGHILPAVP